MTLEEWQGIETIKWKNQESLSLISEEECNLAKQLKICNILDKRRWQVPILLMDETINEVRRLLETRDSVGVHAQNKFVFARMYQDSLVHLDGWKTVNTVALAASLEKPELISSTRIRKELATTLQRLD